MNIELLEARIAPASVLTFTDVDGDTVKITSTTGDLNAPGVATFDDVFAGKMLKLLDLRDASFQGASVKTIVTKFAGGDGVVHIGRIDATGRDLGSVTIKGDLGVIDAGDPAAPTPALKLLDVHSMGRWGQLTQGGFADLVSDFDGSIGPVKVKYDLRDVTLRATGDIASVTLGGSLIGGDENFSGAIQSIGNMGAVKIAGDVIGGAGTNSGRILAGDSAIPGNTSSLASVTIGGSLIGGDADLSGSIQSLGDMGPVKIGHDVIGGGATSSGRILAGDIFVTGNRSNLASLTIGGSLIGGEDGFSSGRVLASDAIGQVSIGGDIHGGGIFSWAGDIGNVTVGGSLIGLHVGGSGTIFSRGDLGAVMIGGDVIGSSWAGSGTIHSDGKIAAVTIRGSLFGGSQTTAGAIESFGDLGAVKIGGNLVAGTATDAGAIRSLGQIANVTIHGSLAAVDDFFVPKISATQDLGAVRIGHDVGGAFSGGLIESKQGRVLGVTVGGSFSGELFSKLALGPVKIGGNIVGYDSNNPGRIRSDAGMASVTVGGSVVGGNDANIVHADTGEIRALGSIGFVKIGGDLRGGAGSNSGTIITSTSVPQVSIGGSVIGGSGFQSGNISVGGSVNSLTIGGDLRGGSITGSQSTSYSGFIAVGIVNGGGGRLGSLMIGGSILAGSDESTGSFTRSASIQVADDIGSLTVKGSIRGSVSSGGEVFVNITAAGQAKNVAFGKINVGGGVEVAQFLAGFGASLTAAVNGNAQIGAVTIGGDWDTSSISAGVNPTNSNFGDNDDAVANQPVGAGGDAILSRIASITIKGAVLGAGNPFFNTGFVAQHIGSFKAGEYVAPLTAGLDGPFIVTPFLPNVSVREI